MTDERSSEPLNDPRRERFCQLIAADQDVPAAFELAGFTPSRQNARRLSKRPDIERRIKFLRSQRGLRVDDTVPQALAEQWEKSDLDRRYVLDALMENVEIAMGRKLVKLRIMQKQRKGPPIIHEAEITDRNAHAANKGIELMGKELGMFETKPMAPDESTDEKGEKTNSLTLSEEELLMHLAQKHGKVLVERAKPAKLQ